MRIFSRIIILLAIGVVFLLAAPSTAAAGYCCDGSTDMGVATEDMCFFTWKTTPCAGEGSAAPAASAGGTSVIVPSCLLYNSVAEMKAAGCDNINIFIVFAINIGKYIFSFIGALALLMFVYGGFMLILSQGNQEKVKKGTGAMTAAVIGLVIAFSAYALVTFLGNTIGVKMEKSLNRMNSGNTAFI